MGKIPIGILSEILIGMFPIGIPIENFHKGLYIIKMHFFSKF
jgi:hypothetical protein